MAAGIDAPLTHKCPVCGIIHTTSSYYDTPEYDLCDVHFKQYMDSLEDYEYSTDEDVFEWTRVRKIKDSINVWKK